MPTEEREKLLEELKTDRGRIMEKLKNPKVSGRGELVGLFTKAVKSGSLFDSIVSLGTGMAITQSLEKAKYAFESYSWDTVNSYFGILEQYQSMDILAKKPYLPEHQYLSLCTLKGIHVQMPRTIVI